MSAGGKTRERSIWSNPFTWGWILTLLVFGFFTALFLLNICIDEACNPRWSYFLNSTPNEIGDTIAGLAGSLALIWIIVTVMIQSRELEIQNETLDSQRRESEGVRRAQEAQLVILQQQIGFLEDERRERQSERSFDFVLELVKQIVTKAKKFSQHKVNFEVWDDHNERWEHRAMVLIDNISSEVSDVVVLENLLRAINSLVSLSSRVASGKVRKLDNTNQSMADEFRKQIHQISSELGNLTSGQIERLKSLNVLDLINEASALESSLSFLHASVEAM